MERVRSGLRIPNTLNLNLIEEAKQRGFSKNALILQILLEWVDNNGLSPAPPVQATDPAQLQLPGIDPPKAV